MCAKIQCTVSRMQHQYRPICYLNRVVGGIREDMGAICYEEECADEHTADSIVKYGFAFEHISTSEEIGDKIKKIPRFIAKEKLLYLERRIWSELKHMYSNLGKKQYDLRFSLANMLFSKYTNLGDFINAMACNPQHSILSHLSSIVCICYYINNKMIKSGNQKAIYSMNVCNGYYNVLQTGFLLKKIDVQKSLIVCVGGECTQEPKEVQSTTFNRRLPSESVTRPPSSAGSTQEPHPQQALASMQGHMYPE